MSQLWPLADLSVGPADMRVLVCPKWAPGSEGNLTAPPHQACELSSSKFFL